MTTARTCVQDFSTANKLYVNAVVTFYTVLDGEKTAQKATLYSGITGSGVLKNPQTLDSFGKFRNPVYIEEEVIATITGLQNVEDHDTGIVALRPAYEFMGVVIQQVEDNEFKLIINAPFRMIVHSITTVCESGTCTITGKIEGTDLGGSANSVSSTEQEQEHEDDNIIEIGDTFSIVVSSNVSCLNASVTIKFSR